MNKLLSTLLFLSIGLACGRPDESSTPSKPSGHLQALEPLIKEGKVKITRDGSLEVISVFGPNQYQTTGTYDCWIHAPFNAWRLFEGDSIESFAGKDWEKNLVKEIAQYKKQAGISQSIGGDSLKCLTETQLLKPLVSSEDFWQIHIRGNNFSADSKGPNAMSRVYFLDSSFNTDLGYLSKADYEYFSSDPEGKRKYKEFEDYLGNCSAILRNDLLDVTKKCFDAVKEKITSNHYSDTNIKTLVDNYSAGKTLAFALTINRYLVYQDLISGFSYRIKRLRAGYSQVVILGFERSADEYPLDHAIAAKIVAPKADTIIVVNSENRHLGAIKTLKMLHKIFTLPLPEELK